MMRAFERSRIEGVMKRSSKRQTKEAKIKASRAITRRRSQATVRKHVSKIMKKRFSLTKLSLKHSSSVIETVRSMVTI